MKRLVFSVILTLIALVPLTADKNDFPTYYHTFRDMHTFSTFYPRTENSPGERSTLEYLHTKLDNMGVSYSRDSLDSYSDFHSFSSTIDVRIKGQSEDSLYFVFPINHSPDRGVHQAQGAGLALALSLIDELRNSTPPVSIHILFMGAEKGREPDYRLGSQAFLDTFSPPHKAAFVYVDIESLPTRMDIQPAGSGEVGPAWILDSLHRAISSADVDYRVRPSRFQIYRLGLNDTPTPIDPYLREGFPASYLTSAEKDGRNRVNKSRQESYVDMPASFSALTESLLRFINMFEGGLPTKEDSHYLFLNIGENLLLINEVYYVLLLLFILAATLSYPFLRPKSFIKYARSLVRHLSVVPMLFLFMFIFLYLSTLLIDRLMDYRNFSSLTITSPLLLLALKVSASAFLFSISHHLLKLAHINRWRGSFYSASALLFILFVTILLTLVDISLTFYGVWILFFSFLFSLARGRIMKIIYLVLSMSLLILFLLRIFSSSHYDAIELVLLSEFRGNLIIALILLPFMLMIIRVRMLFHHPNPRITKWIIVSTDLVLAAVAVTLVALFLNYQPYSDERRPPLQIRETLDLNERSRTIRLSGPTQIGNVEIGGPGYSLPSQIQTSDYSERLPIERDFLDMRIEREDFLGRVDYSITLTPESPPEEVEVRLSSNEEIVLYDSSFPVEYVKDRKELLIHIGRFPPTPLEFFFTLPGDFEGTLSTSVTYYRPPYPARLPEENFEIDYRMSIQASRPISRSKR